MKFVPGDVKDESQRVHVFGEYLVCSQGMVIDEDGTWYRNTGKHFSIEEEEPFIVICSESIAKFKSGSQMNLIISPDLVGWVYT